MTTTYKRPESSGSSRRAVADHTASHAVTYSAVPALQRKRPEGENLQVKPAIQLAQEEEEGLQMKAATQLATPEEELQMKSVRQMKGMAGRPFLQKKEDSAAPAVNRTGMPDHLKTGIENLSGIALDDVKVHYNSSQPAQLNALAYAQGTDIHIGPGQERHLPHEAWHVVQQSQGRVRPTLQAKGVSINDNEGLEKEADVMGGRAFQFVESQSGAIAQRKSQKIANNYTSQQRSIVQKKGNEPIQLKGDKYYWVKPNGGTWTYVGAFKNHTQANKWWAANKSNYPGGGFSQGNSKTKFK